MDHTKVNDPCERSVARHFTPKYARHDARLEETFPASFILEM